MTASDALLRRLEQDSSLAAALAWPGDFDVDRRDPSEDLVLPSGRPLHPVAGCGAGGTTITCRTSFCFRAAPHSEVSV
ncbi:hypothetical protein ACIQMO_13275 [Streptomyces sp. NPDC091406]|uniref:hypothetical protein n=1 Tax=unclassified Streptomyces TaxID=2593676 RepID=UPI0037F2F779